MQRRTFLTGAAGIVAGASAGASAGAVVRAEENRAPAGRKPAGAALFARENLIAWCIVPFDARKRGPEERAEMLQRLGIRRFAYDWRAEHLSTLDRELDALRKHGVRLEAFWFPSGLEPEREAHVRTILEFLRRRKVETQLWLSLGMKEEGDQAQRVETAARPVRWAAEEAARIGCKVALYNHGGWFGEPENQVAIVRRVALPNVGIVYNFHHGHGHIDRFAELFRLMEPHLFALNINGMRRDGPKILGVGKGDAELGMLRTVARSGYHGPVGILGHREELDAEVALRENLHGLRELLPKLETGTAGPEAG